MTMSVGRVEGGVVHGHWWRGHSLAGQMSFSIYGGRTSHIVWLERLEEALIGGEFEHSLHLRDMFLSTHPLWGRVWFGVPRSRHPPQSLVPLSLYLHNMKICVLVFSQFVDPLSWSSKCPQLFITPLHEHFPKVIQLGLLLQHCHQSCWIKCVLLVIKGNSSCSYNRYYNNTIDLSLVIIHDWEMDAWRRSWSCLGYSREKIQERLDFMLGGCMCKQSEV